jgi:hypothetical protein
MFVLMIGASADARSAGAVEGAALMLPAAVPPPPLAVAPPYLFTAVAGVSADQVWVVGQVRGGPLAARWDGDRWSAPPNTALVPGAALIGAGLEGIAARGAETIAVGGGYDRRLGVSVPLLWRWTDGGWHAQSPPALDDGYVLTSVAVLGDGRACAVGHRQAGGLIALSGTRDGWRAWELPSVPRGRLLAVTGISGSDVWAVGADGHTGLIVHFDGDRWRRVPCPKTRFPLSDVAVTGPDSAWCVGGGDVLRWNGRRWSSVKVPIGSANTVAAVSAGSVWIGGAQGELAHFDGRGWTAVSAPQPAVWRASAVTEDTVWMAGALTPPSA